MKKDPNTFELPAELEELKEYPNWVVYKLVPDKQNADGSQHYKKLPMNPRKPRTGAKADDPKTWGTYEQAMTAWKKDPGGLQGLGFEFGGTPYVGVDLDHVQDPSTGCISEEAADIVGTLESYTEYSPSGTGFHIICKGTLPSGARRKGNIEMYETGRYFTVTGDTFRHEPVREVQDELETVHSKYLARSEQPAAPNPFTESTWIPSKTDNEVLQEMARSSRAGQLMALYQGDTAGHGGDQSAADLALCNALMWFTGHDKAQTDRLFRGSGLMRDKWDEVHRREGGGSMTYGQMTIERAAEVSRREAPHQQAQQTVDFMDWGDMIHTDPNEPVAVNTPEQTIQDADPEPEISQEEQRANAERAYVLSHRASRRIGAFTDWIQEAGSTEAVPTGYQQLDQLLDGGLYPGLYTIGAISSLGKTTFAMQMADYIAAHGTPVLVVSMEMAEFELYSKSISKLTYHRAIEETGDTKTAKTARGITNFKRWNGYVDTYGNVWKPYSRKEVDLIERCIDEYENTAAQHLFILEGSGKVGHREIARAAQIIAQDEGRPPVVLVDYIQILKADDVRATDKQNTDKNVLALKNLSRDLNTPVIAISSLNRQNYSNAISFEAFKESGALEYGSDVMMGLQLKGAGEKSFNATEAKAKDPREIELVLLKNRNGRIPEAPLEFDYHPKFNVFEESIF